MPEQDPSRFETFKQGVQERFDGIKQNINRLTAIGEVAGLGVGIGLGLVTPAGAEEPAQGANIPVLEAESSAFADTLVPGPKGLVSAEASSAEATASDQLQNCVDAALAKPVKMWSTMYFPGDTRDSRQQWIDGYMRFKPTSAVCAPLVSRETPVAQVKMQRPNNHSKFIKSKKKGLEGHDEDGGAIPMDANGGRLGGVSFGKYYGDGNKLTYRCSPKGITHAWMTYNLRAVSPVDGHVLGKRSITQPIKISRIPRSADIDGLHGPC